MRSTRLWPWPWHLGGERARAGADCGCCSRGWDLGRLFFRGAGPDPESVRIQARPLRSNLVCWRSREVSLPNDGTSVAAAITAGVYAP